MSIVQSILSFIKWLCGVAEYRIDRHQRRQRHYQFKKQVTRNKGLTVPGSRGLRRKW